LKLRAAGGGSFRISGNEKANEDTMAKLTLQFDSQVLNECAIGLMATIGRLPDNTLVIDNPAVSSHHACVFRDGNHYVVEDLESTNGTFVNEQRVTRQVLRNGDVLLVGKHKLVFDEVGGGEPADSEEAARVISNLGDTVFLDTKKHRELLAKLREAQGDAAGVGMTVKMHTVPAAKVVGVLRVVSGKTERNEYMLEGRTSMIGKSTAALIRLQGWFKPDLAVAITRNGDGYVASRLNGKTLINNRPLDGRHELKKGDVLQVAGLTLEFRLKE
jgi:pSer/pThr/pTyr-binding forkhead associated (FHA) protein